MKREIEEYPYVPLLSPQAIELLTHLCFRKDDREVPAVDCIFVLGSTHSLELIAKEVSSLLQKEVSKKVILTGGHVTYDGSNIYDLSQSKMLQHYMRPFLQADIEVILEEASQNTLENVYLGLRLCTFPLHSLCFITKNFHCGRSYFTLRRHLTQPHLFQRSYEPFYSDLSLTLQRANWHQHPLARARVWGEFLRIREYGKRNDICIEECEHLIASIEESIDF